MTPDGKITADLIAAAWAVGKRDLRLGIVNEDELRYQLIASDRKKAVAKLKENGLSNRKIGKVLGYSPQTIGRDLNVPNGTLNVPNGTPARRVPSPEKPKRRPPSNKTENEA